MSTSPGVPRRTGSYLIDPCADRDVVEVVYAAARAFSLAVLDQTRSREAEAAGPLLASATNRSRAAYAADTCCSRGRKPGRSGSVPRRRGRTARPVVYTRRCGRLANECRAEHEVGLPKWRAVAVRVSATIRPSAGGLIMAPSPSGWGTHVRVSASSTSSGAASALISRRRPRSARSAASSSQRPIDRPATRTADKRKRGVGLGIELDLSHLTRTAVISTGPCGRRPQVERLDGKSRHLRRLRTGPQLGQRLGDRGDVTAWSPPCEAWPRCRP